MVDAVNLLRTKETQDLSIQRDGTFQIVPERFLNDDACPRLFHIGMNQLGTGQAFDDGAKELGIDCQIEKPIAGQMLFFLQGLHAARQRVHAVGRGDVRALVKNMGEKFGQVSRLAGRVFGKFAQALANLDAKSLIGFLFATHADDRKIRR